MWSSDNGYSDTPLMLYIICSLVTKFVILSLQFDYEIQSGWYTKYELTWQFFLQM